MKPFDLERAKAGDPIQTRYEEHVKFIAHVPEARECYRVVYLLNGHILTTHEDTQHLFMASVKREGWVNVYLDHLAVHYVVAQGRIWDCKESACAVASSIDAKIATVKIEWEEK